MKKILSLILCVVLAFVIIPSRTFATNERDVTFSATLSTEELPYSEESQTIIMTVKPNKAITVDSVKFKINVPDNWTVIGIEDDVLDYNISNDYNPATNIVQWNSSDSEAWTTNGLAKITISIPAGAEAKTYTLKVTGIELCDDYGEIWEDSAEVSTTLNIISATPTIPVTGIEIVEPEYAGAAIATEETVQIVVKIIPDDATNKNVTYVSNDESVASVSENGLVTGKAQGSTSIIVTTEDGGFSEEVFIDVLSRVPVPEGLEYVYDGYEHGLEETEEYSCYSGKEIYVGEYVSYVTPKDGYIWDLGEDGTIIDFRGVSWKIVPAEQPAEVTTSAELEAGGEELDLNTLVSGMKGTIEFTLTEACGCTLDGSTLKSGDDKGTAKVAYKITGENVDGDGEAEYKDKEGTITVTITAPSVSSVSIEPSHASIATDETVQLTATVLPEAAENKKVSWSSGDESVATVDENGLVTGIGKGSATITATTENGGLTATALITVNERMDLPTIEELTCVYTGSEQFPAGGEKYTLSGDLQTYVGEYTALATPKEGYVWNLRSTSADPQTVGWAIVAAEQPAEVAETAELEARGKTLDLNTLVTGMEGTIEFTLGSAGGCTLEDGVLKSGNETGTATVSYKITGKDVNEDGAAEYEDAEGEITVTIKDAPKYTVTVAEAEGGEGAATPASNYAGETVQLSATANDGYRFAKWELKDEGASIADETNAETTLTLGEANVTVTPVFDKEVEKPEAKTGLKYSGEEQTGVEEGEGYTLSGTVKATDVGSYTATASLKEGYVWKDGSKEDVTLEWSIEVNEDGIKDGSVTASVGDSGSLAPEELGEDASVSYEVEENDGVIEFDAQTGTFKAVKEGSAKVRVFYTGSANYGSGDYLVTITVTNAPSTGDANLIGRYGALATISFAMLIAYLFGRKRKARCEK